MTIVEVRYRKDSDVFMDVYILGSDGRTKYWGGIRRDLYWALEDFHTKPLRDPSAPKHGW